MLGEKTVSVLKQFTVLEKREKRREDIPKGGRILSALTRSIRICI